MWHSSPHSQLSQPPSKSSRNCSQYTNYYWDDLQWSTNTNSFDLVLQVKVNGVWPEGLSSCPVTQNVNQFWKTLLSVGFLTGEIILIIAMIIITVGYDDFFFMLRRPWDLRPLNFLPVVFSRMGLSDFHSKALGKQHEGIHRSLRELLHAVSFHHASGTSWLREKLASAMSVLLFILLYLKINLKTDICTKIVWNAVVKMCQVEGRIFFNS